MLILFPHHSAIKSSENIRWKQACISPSEPIIQPDQSWEIARTNLYGSVIKTDRGYEMFYQCGNAVRVSRAVSDDGLNWSKPMINRTDFSTESEGLHLSPLIDSKEVSDDSESADIQETNVQVTNLVASAHMPSVIYRPDGQTPYKMFAFGRHGYFSLESKDGCLFNVVDDPVVEFDVHENQYTEKKWGSDVGPCVWDGEQFVAMTKTYMIDDEERTRRCVGRITCDDFKTWSGVSTIWEPGESEDKIAQSRGYEWADFYGLCPFKYGEGYLGFLWLFEIEKELPHGTHLGKIEVFLASSPDGLNWDRVSDQAFIPWDLNFGDLGGMVTTASSPIFEEDEIKVFYSDSNYEHSFYERDFDKQVKDPTWVIRCAQVPKERLLGAYSDNGSLVLETGSLNKKMLRLNADCESGSICVEYVSKGKVCGQHHVEHLNDTNIYIEPLGNDVDSLIVTMNKATLYAVEVI